MPRSPDDPATGGGGEYVAVDLETTGLDPAADRIIEIGAVRFGADGLRERFRTFVSPGRPLPPAIRMLTKIEDADLVGAPPPSLAVHEFAAFARGLPLVAHNAPFDLGFLAEAGLQPQAPAFDSYELASVLLPTATRLDLSSLAGSLGVEITEAHRALADAEATAEVFLRLLERLERLPGATLRDLVRLAEQSAWSLAPLFAGALDRRGIGAASDALAPGALAREAQALPPPLRPLPEFTPLDEDEVEARFAEARRRADLLPGFEAREGQIAMARAVTANIAHDGQLAVEAGTGTGKSLAYLVPALSHALRSDERVVISTHTLNLQEQLAEREMPAAAALAESAAGARPGSLRTAVLKGRGNYLCLERWSQAIESEEPRSAGQARVLARIAVWLGETERGDRAELYLRGDEWPHWRALAADTNDCLQRRCAFVREGSCFLQRARAEAAAAHVLVVNHALLLVNATGGDQLLPPFRHLVVDEAHRLEGVATSQFGDTVALHEIAQLLDEVTAGGGSLAASLRGAARLDPMPLSPAAGLAHLADEIASAAVLARARLPDLEAAIAGYVEEFADRARGSQLQITPGRRAQPLWGDVEDGALHLELALDQLARRLLHAQSMVDSLPADGAPALATLRAALARAAETAARQAATLRDALQRADPGRIVWLDSSGRSPRVRTAPLDVADRLEDELWARRDSVLVTSATLTAQQRFDFSLRRIGLPDADVLDVGSPFDYRRAVLTLVVDDLPPPDAPDHEAAAQWVLGEAARAAGGRTLALFTSHGAIRSAAAALRGPLANDGIGVLAHDLDGGPARLLRALAERPRSLVLGTAAFWEGVDVPGPALSQLVLARLPFPVPTDPVHAARAALHEDAFGEYMLPQAVLRFRQGFGRLIRGPQDRGVFLILDRRVSARAYGEAFLNALPECEQRKLGANEVPAAVAAWLGEAPRA